MLTIPANRSQSEAAACLKRLGFPDARYVTGRASIADLYPRHQRCGIYVLEFATGEFYVGQAKDVTRRFVQHTKNHDDIQLIRFQAISEERLTEVERRALAALDGEHIPLRNIALTSIPHGDSDLDTVLGPSVQERWLTERSYQDWSGDRAADPDLRRKHVRKFSRLLEMPHADELIDVVRKYVHRGIPAPLKTELSFWSVTVLPRDRRAKLYIRINLHLQEVLGAGVDEDVPVLWLYVAASPLRSLGGDWSARLRTNLRFGAQWPDHRYPSGGTDQQQVVVEGIENMKRLLGDDQVLAAIRLYNLRLMKKGPSLNSRSHCFALADQLIRYENEE